MGTANSSAARIGEPAAIDPMTGFEAANDAYGSLAMLVSRPKPKKKPVLVLDADELAAAHLLFQQGAAEQLEDADRIERAPMMLGLAPLGSDAETDDLPGPDEDEYTIEADAPAPEDVLNMTRPVQELSERPQKSFRKLMVALPPDGDPALDAIEPFVPLAPSDEEASDEDFVETELGFEAELEAEAEPEAELEAENPATDAVAELTDEAAEVFVDGAALDDAAHAPTEETAPAEMPHEEIFDEEDVGTAPDKADAIIEATEPYEPLEVHEAEPEDALGQDEIAEAPAEESAAVQEPGNAANETDLSEEEEVDGYAFMRSPEQRKLLIPSAGTQHQNSLRARLIKDFEPEIEEPDPTWRSRLADWFARAWQRFLG